MCIKNIYSCIMFCTVITLLTVVDHAFVFSFNVFLKVFPKRKLFSTFSARMSDLIVKWFNVKRKTCLFQKLLLTYFTFVPKSFMLDSFVFNHTLRSICHIFTTIFITIELLIIVRWYNVSLLPFTVSLCTSVTCCSRRCFWDSISLQLIMSQG